MRRWDFVDWLWAIFIYPVGIPFWLFIWVVLVVSAMIGVEHRKARAHDWYPPDCCSDNDCRMLPASRVKAMRDGGYLIDGLIAIQRERVRPSPDGEYHACMPTAIHVRCFWAPRPSS